MPADVDLLSSLLQALGQSRWQDAVRLGEQIADSEARKGHSRVARKLRGALAPREESESADGFSFTPVGAPLAGALLPLSPVDGLDDVVLPTSLRSQLGEVLQEWRLRAKLDVAGVARRTKLLFHGPPGSGKTLTARALGGEMSLPVLVVSMHPEDQFAVRILKAGAAGYLTKESAGEELVGAIKKVTGGGKYISPSLAERMASYLAIDVQKAPHERLSDREFLVLRMIASGKPVSEIAKELSLSVATISTYRARLLEKMDMKNNAELTHYAIQKGLVS
jgi:DNA-binding NarL/FixJ family response regulator